MDEIVQHVYRDIWCTIPKSKENDEAFLTEVNKHIDGIIASKDSLLKLLEASLIPNITLIEREEVDGNTVAE